LLVGLTGAVLEIDDFDRNGLVERLVEKHVLAMEKFERRDGFL